MTQEIEQQTMSKYDIVKLEGGYYRTEDGICYISRQGGDSYVVYSCDGENSWIYYSFIRACMKAKKFSEKFAKRC